jgi:exoribonuclease R
MKTISFDKVSKIQFKPEGEPGCTLKYQRCQSLIEEFMLLAKSG